jgi:hypothetical protein
MKAASAPTKVALAELEDVPIQTRSEGQATLRRLFRLRWGLAARHPPADRRQRRAGAVDLAPRSLAVNIRHRPAPPA